MTEFLLRAFSIALICRFLYEAIMGMPDKDTLILSAVFALWADVLKGNRHDH